VSTAAGGTAIDRALVETGPAVFSSCRRYRYRLERRWHSRGKVVNFLLLNPSTADESTLDPTLRRCAGYARLWNYAGMVITNIFALRSTEPEALYDAPDPVGPDNDEHIVRAARECALLIVGWGNHGVLRDRGLHVRSLIAPHSPRCLRVSKLDQPVHPLYLPASASPQAFAPAAAPSRGSRTLRTSSTTRD
jgi:hypothetical protein